MTAIQFFIQSVNFPFLSSCTVIGGVCPGVYIILDINIYDVKKVLSVEKCRLRPFILKSESIGDHVTNR